MGSEGTRIEQRVEDVAEALLARDRSVSPVLVLNQLGWLAAPRIDEWRQGRLECLEAGLQVNPAKLGAALAALGAWAQRRGLQPSEVEEVSRTRERRPLRFSCSGDADAERVYRTHWLSPDLSPAQRDRLVERKRTPPDLVVIAPLRDWTCSECGGTGGLLVMDEPGPLCLRCADLDHLVYLPRGDATLTRRAKKASGLAAVVVRFSRSRKRYERQGVLVEEPALEEAERSCLADAEARERRRDRDRERRAVADEAFVERFAAAIVEQFPGCPPARTTAIARHAALRGSGRVGRSAAGRALDDRAVELAVVASVRHEDTDYDDLLMAGVDRHDARTRVQPEVGAVLDRWRAAGVQ